MTFEIFKAFPPDRHSPVVELHVPDDGMVSIPTVVYRENDELRIALFAPEGGVAWDYPLDEWLTALHRAVDALQE